MACECTRHLTRYGDVLSDFCRQILSLQLSVTKVLTRTVVKDCSAFRCCLGYRKQRKDEGKLLIFLMQSTWCLIVICGRGVIGCNRHVRRRCISDSSCRLRLFTATKKRRASPWIAIVQIAIIPCSMRNNQSPDAKQHSVAPAPGTPHIDPRAFCVLPMCNAYTRSRWNAKQPPKMKGRPSPKNLRTSPPSLPHLPPAPAL